MFERVAGWFAAKTIRATQAYGRSILRQARCQELHLRKVGRFDDANTVREYADGLERFIEYGYELAPC